MLGPGQIFSTRWFLLINHLIGLTMAILQQTRVQRQAVLTYRNLQEKMRIWEPLTFWDVNSHGPRKAPGSWSTEGWGAQERSGFEAQKGPAECQESSCYKADTLTGFTHTNIRFLLPGTPLLTLRNPGWFAEVPPRFSHLQIPWPQSSTFTGNLMVPSNIWPISDIQQRLCSWEKKI